MCTRVCLFVCVLFYLFVILRQLTLQLKTGIYGFIDSYLMIYGLSYIFEGKFMKNFFFRHKPSTSLIWIQLIKIFFLFGLIDLMKIQIYIVFVFTKVIKGSQFLSGYIYSL